MNKLKAWMFNRKASSWGSKPEEILEALALKPRQHVADVGVGGGYFSLRFAEAVGGGGLVYAVDTNQGFLDILMESSRRRGLRNIRAVPAGRIRSLIPEGSLDYVFLRSVYHHLRDRVRYMRDISAYLKPGGRVAIIEYCGGGGFSFHKLFGHYVPEERIVEEMVEAGYEVGERFVFLSKQSFMFFSRIK